MYMECASNRMAVYAHIPSIEAKEAYYRGKKDLL